jgi:hypothetical protein
MAAAVVETEAVLTWPRQPSQRQTEIEKLP